MRRPFYRAPGMPLQRWLADPARGDGSASDGTPGDCFRTSFAGALGLPRDSVPHFVGMSERGAVWWWELQRWGVETFGCNIYNWTPKAWERNGRPGYPGGRGFVVLGGPSPRGAFAHAVVGNHDLDVVHDPHPLGVGLTAVDTVFVMRLGDWAPPERRALEAKAE